MQGSQPVRVLYYQSQPAGEGSPGMKKNGKSALDDIRDRERKDPAFAAALRRERARLDKAEDEELRVVLRRARQILGRGGKRLETPSAEAAPHGGRGRASSFPQACTSDY